MSIIYDALQKTQRNRSQNRVENQSYSPYGMRWIDKVLIATVVILVGVIIYACWPYVKTKTHAPVSIVQQQQPASVEPSSVIPAAPNGLVLNGVLMSDQNQTALINNQLYHLGDRVAGLRIVGIELNNVRLQDGDKILVLKTNS